MKKCSIVYNPKSGKKLPNNALEQITDLLLKYGYDSKIIYTEYKGHAKTIVKDLPDQDLLISIGGDGTFSEVVSENVKRDKPILLAHLPQGTTNDVAVMYGYNGNIVQNLHDILEGKRKSVDICTINDQVFTYSACFGKFADIPYETPVKLKKRIGYLAYVLYGIKRIITKPRLYDIDFFVDGKKYSGKYTFAILSNADRIAGINNVYQDIKLDDGRFEILFCTLTNKYQVIKSIRYLLKREINKAPGFEFYRAKEITLKFNNKLEKNWCIDGEELEDLSDTFIVESKYKVELLLPNRNLDRLFRKSN